MASPPIAPFKLHSLLAGTLGCKHQCQACSAQLGKFLRWFWWKCSFCGRQVCNCNLYKPVNSGQVHVIISATVTRTASRNITHCNLGIHSSIHFLEIACYLYSECLITQIPVDISWRVVGTLGFLYTCCALLVFFDQTTCSLHHKSFDNRIWLVVFLD